MDGEWEDKEPVYQRGRAGGDTGSDRQAKGAAAEA